MKEKILLQTCGYASQAYLGDSGGVAPNHCNKVGIAMKGVSLTFWFLSALKVMLIYYKLS